uniref:AP-1 complex subunit sigma-1A n=1 Tax=Schistocephalus solidus TaxID=70667 RepID=A0A0X3NIJ3_SCHSO
MSWKISVRNVMWEYVHGMFGLIQALIVEETLRDLLLLKHILGIYYGHNATRPGFLHFTSKEKFIKNKICLLEVEDYVKFANLTMYRKPQTHISKILVQNFYITVNYFEGKQFIVFGLYGAQEVETRISD